MAGGDRKTIRRYRALRAGAEANSPEEVTTGPVSVDGQIPPPRPAFGTSEATVTSSQARSAREAHRAWIEEHVRLCGMRRRSTKTCSINLAFRPVTRASSGLYAGCGTPTRESAVRSQFEKLSWRVGEYFHTRPVTRNVSLTT